MTEQSPPPQVPGVLLLQAINIPSQGKIVIQFSPAVTDQLKCALQVAGILVQSSERALDQERADHRPGTQIAIAGPGMRVPRVD